MDEIRPFLDFIGVEASAAAVGRLATFVEWLASEATVAGGIGPNEADDIVDRHVLDSLAFARVWDPSPRDVVDAGTGVGLPGIPLAIAFPDRHFRLIDRSRRRIELLRRAVRILDLPNVAPRHADIGQESVVDCTVVARGSLAAPDLAVALPDVPRETIVADSRIAPHPVIGWESIAVDHEMLARPAWFLRMRPE